MSHFYNYDTRGASSSSQIIWLEDRVKQLEKQLNQQPEAWMVINADGAKSIFADKEEAYEYANWAHGPRPVHPLYRQVT